MNLRELDEIIRHFEMKKDKETADFYKGMRKGLQKVILMKINNQLKGI
tara:strand:+ start:8 stop:151 length:144 start_codon:yes stop_codon:yes gene_type:complete